MRKARTTLLALVALATAFVAGAMEHDIRQLQERLAEQEARIGDMNAKLNYSESGDSPEGIVSLRKNAVVTIGGLINTKYQHTRGKVKSYYEYDEANDEFNLTQNYRRRGDLKSSSLELSDAEVSIQIDVNEHFDAFLNMDLHNATNNDYYIPDVYYVRWKNICESGFGLKVGRDALVFGDEGVGELGSYAAGTGDGIGEYEEFDGHMGAWSAIPAHNGWDVSGVTQVTPYWEGLDGKLSLELSFMNHIYDDTPYVNGGQSDTWYIRDKNGHRKYRSRNYGVGTMSARAVITPIEDLKFTLSAANYRSNGDNEVNDYSNDWHMSKNNTVFGVAVSYRPCFFNRLFVWGQWIHGKDVLFHEDMDSDAINFGASFDITESLTFFAQGDYLRTKYGFQSANEKATAWAFYTGLTYSLPYGVTLEAGWKHEDVKFKSDGAKYAKIKADTIYAMCGLEF